MPLIVRIYGELDISWYITLQLACLCKYIIEYYSKIIKKSNYYSHLSWNPTGSYVVAFPDEFAVQSTLRNIPIKNSVPFLKQSGLLTSTNTSKYIRN